MRSSYIRESVHFDTLVHTLEHTKSTKKTHTSERMRKRKKIPKTHRVYCTYFPDKRYYIGYSCKDDKQYEKYYGSSRQIREFLQENSTDELKKETIVEYKQRSEAKLQEMLLQLQYKDDIYCINDMLHIRIRLSYIKDDFDIVDWKPRDYHDL